MPARLSTLTHTCTQIGPIQPPSRPKLQPGGCSRVHKERHTPRHTTHNPPRSRAAARRAASTNSSNTATAALIYSYTPLVPLLLCCLWLYLQINDELSDLILQVLARIAVLLEIGLTLTLTLTQPLTRQVANGVRDMARGSQEALLNAWKAAACLRLSDTSTRLALS